MVGRNFWATKNGAAWIVREEGLPDQSSSHDSREEAWMAAQARAEELGGEAFLADEDGAICERKWFGQQPRDIKI